MAFYYVNDERMPQYKWLCKLEGDFAFLAQVNTGKAIFIEHDAFKEAKHAKFIRDDSDIEDIFILTKSNFDELLQHHQAK